MNNLDRVRAACAEMTEEFFPEALCDFAHELGIQKIRDALAVMRKNQEIESRLVIRHGKNTHLYSPGVRGPAPRADSRIDIGNKQSADRLGEVLGMPRIQPINEMAVRYVSLG